VSRRGAQSAVPRRAQRRARWLSGALACALALVLTACASGSKTTSSERSRDHARGALGRYLQQVEPLRLAVNELLNGADPILDGFREHRLNPREAQARMGALERRFAAYSVQIAEIKPTVSPLRTLQAEYAGTYVLEDAYLSALTSGLGEDDFDQLPDTQAAQRATIIRWRIGLEVMAKEVSVSLPGDLQQAGRGEIAPSPTSGS
jgi:hypothetical protein